MSAPLPIILERRIAVCVVDDDVLRAIVCDALEHCGFTALQGVDGFDGLDLLHRHERVDVIVLQLGRDPRDARAFRSVQRLDPAHRYVPVVVIAGPGADALPLRAPLVLRTPLSIENLVEGVRGLVALPQRTGWSGPFAAAHP